MKVTSFLPSVLAAAGIAITSSFLMPSSAQAFRFGFENITSNNAMNAATGEAQLFVDVLDASGGENLTSNQVMFKFSNVGQAASSITQIYFDNSTVLKSITSITDSGDGVSFSEAKKGNLPGGNNVKFTEDFVVDAKTPVSSMGVNPGEFVNIFFDLTSGNTLQNVFNDLTSGSLRLGFHVQAFSDGKSESFVNKPDAPGGGTGGGNGGSTKVPEPGTVAALALMVGGLRVVRRRKSN
ncbi:PEP-CTERM sorting domain-containing protein [Coleofasciculus sp. FACHB-64]|uniref:PEP-CTERM sorting domain-containing protein n=1 Tax=Cyanophyceae TaxID=3028117 RepID=UPI001683CC5D|nr:MULTISPECIES: PEP-CTERM sorting domain-containing protein [unclassified Coleofasciculus]MBD1839180.1 PEP-CTERM sorting domain-containing protein [Coleofasciculus sp. FACHB-501]MBD2047615.1 PEP-CTERM sorting domain-containing protein [Coleofasciculus sp. FACHB-64]